MCRFFGDLTSINHLREKELIKNETKNQFWGGHYSKSLVIRLSAVTLGLSALFGFGAAFLFAESARPVEVATIDEGTTVLLPILRQAILMSFTTTVT
jgi:hypothetical protein